MFQNTLSKQYLKTLPQNTLVIHPGGGKDRSDRMASNSSRLELDVDLEQDLDVDLEQVCAPVALTFKLFLVLVSLCSVVLYPVPFAEFSGGVCVSPLFLCVCGVIWQWFRHWFWQLMVEHLFSALLTVSHSNFLWVLSFLRVFVFSFFGVCNLAMVLATNDWAFISALLTVSHSNFQIYLGLVTFGFFVCCRLFVCAFFLFLVCVIWQWFWQWFWQRMVEHLLFIFCTPGSFALCFTF